MREIRTSGSISADGERSDATWWKLLCPSSTLSRCFRGSEQYRAKRSKLRQAQHPRIARLCGATGSLDPTAPDVASADEIDRILRETITNPVGPGIHGAAGAQRRGMSTKACMTELPARRLLWPHHT